MGTKLIMNYSCPKRNIVRFIKHQQMLISSDQSQSLKIHGCSMEGKTKQVLT